MNKEPIRRYQCESCGRTFTQRGSLVRHNRLHTGEKPFVCEICGKAFVEKGSLDTHVRLHTGEKPYECRICHQRYAQRASLRGHLRNHTGEKIPRKHKTDPEIKLLTSETEYTPPVYKINISEIDSKLDKATSEGQILSSSNLQDENSNLTVIREFINDTSTNKSDIDEKSETIHIVFLENIVMEPVLNNDNPDLDLNTNENPNNHSHNEATDLRIDKKKE